LAEHLAGLFPAHANVLDVGCGDGWLAAEIKRRRPDLTIAGLDVLVRPDTHIIVTPFDGTHIPFPGRSFDSVLFVDVLHHTADPMILLREARRVARHTVVIKDHTRDGVLAGPTLRLMDWVGNARHGVSLPYNYWTGRQWRTAFDDLGLHPAVWKKDLHLYPAGTRWIFERSLHIIAVLST